MKPFLQVDNLSWHIHNRPLINQLSFELPEKSVTAIVGPNGAGKTSILRCIYGAIKPSSGEIRMQGENIIAIPRRRRAQQIAVVSQHIEHWSHMKVIELIRLGLIPHLNSWQKITCSQHQFVDNIIEKLDIESLKNRYFDNLSGGEQQRVLIAKALVQQPKLLILDEPTNHLDVHYQHQILSLLNQLDVTVLMTVHDLNLASQYCELLLLLKKGELVGFGAPDQVLTQSRVQNTFALPVRMGTNPMTDAKHVFYSWNENAQQEANKQC